MGKLSNQNGYTLILTLILIIVFVIFSSTFAISALNHQNLVEKTDEKYEVTAIAEMGIEYYQNSILNIVEEYRTNNITKNALNKLINYINNPPYVSGKLPDNYYEMIEQYKNEPMNSLNNAIKQHLVNSVGKEVTLIDGQQMYFKIISTTPGDEKDTWTIIVEGNNGIETKQISATFKIPETFQLITSGNGGDTPSIIGEINFKPLLSYPEFPETDYTKINNISECPNDSKSYGSNDTQYKCYLNEKSDSNTITKLENIQNLNLYYVGKTDIDANLNQSFKNLNNLFANQSINLPKSYGTKSNTSYYIKGDFNKSEPIENPNNATIYATGNITLKNINNMSSMEIYTYENLTITEATSAKYLKLIADSVKFNNLNSLENSIFQIEKETIFTNDINNFKDSKLLINNNATFNTINNGINGSKTLINIKGNASFNQKLEMYAGRMEISGTLNLTGNSNSKLEGGTIVVDRVNVSNPNKKDMNNFSITDGKLCIRDFSNTTIMSDIKATSHGEIYFLNTELQDNGRDMLKGSDMTGSHVYQLGKTEFNKECGVESVQPTPSGSYSITSQVLNDNHITEDVTYY